MCNIESQGFAKNQKARIKPVEVGLPRAAKAIKRSESDRSARSSRDPRNGLTFVQYM